MVSRKPRTRGLSLIEVAISMGVLAIALVGMVAAVVQASRAQQLTREHTLAYEAARARLELLRGARFRQVYALYNSDPSDDPDGPGTAPGGSFGVEWLGGASGSIVFPESGTPAALREDLDLPQMGMAGSRDLNLDGLIDDAPRSRDYRILPVTISIRWDGLQGPSRFDLSALLAERLR